MKMMLDATAGNRMIWPNKHPQNVVFMDKELRLAFPPHLFADFRELPFRSDVFDCVLFDPPHSCSIPPWWADPSASKKMRGNSASWYGKFENKRDMFTSINKAQREFMRVSERLCLKWSELEVSLWKILPFFRGWKMIHKREMSKGRTKTYWVTFVRTLHRTPKEDSCGPSPRRRERAGER